MKALIVALVLACVGVPALETQGADDSRVKAATGQVEHGAKKIGAGKIGEGVQDTAKGIGNTVVEGAKYTGDKLKESSKAAEPKAKSSWDSFKDSASSFGQSVKSFFSRLLSS